MQIFVSGQHVSIGDSLQDYVKDKTIAIVSKHAHTVNSTNVHFIKEGFRFICDIVLNDGTGRKIAINSDAAANDIYSAFDVSLIKLEKQLRKHKSKFKKHNDKVKASQVIADEEAGML